MFEIVLIFFKNKTEMETQLLTVVQELHTPWVVFVITSV